MAFLKYRLQNTSQSMFSSQVRDGVNSPVGTMEIGVQVSARAFKNPEGIF